MGVKAMRELCEKYFSGIEDTRCQCDVEHKLVDVLIIIMCAVLCGLDKPDDIEAYGKEKLSFLNKHFGITKVPSDSTLSRIMNMVDGDAVSGCIVKIMQERLGISGEIIAVDGKTIRSTGKRDGVQEKLHILTAYMTENGVTLGQLAVNEKTNEIPVMRELLEMVDIQGKIITADALHCQKETVKKIISQGGNYVLGLKGNQEIFFEEIKSYIDDCIEDKNIEVETATTTEKNKDRLEQRTIYKAPNLDWLANKDEWSGLKTAFCVQRKITTKRGVSNETSYYIASIDLPAARLLEIVREHWKIESMHWLLDVVFTEDDCRLLSSNGQKTLNTFRKLAIALHKNYVSSLTQKTKPSFSNNMLKALMNNELLLKVLGVSL